MTKRGRIIIVTLIVTIVLGVGSFITLQFYNPFRKYPTESPVSKQYTIEEILMPSCPKTTVFEKNSYMIDLSNKA